MKWRSNLKECEKATTMDWLKAQNQSGQCFGRDSNQAAPKYESKVLLPGQIFSVSVITHMLQLTLKPSYDHHDCRRKWNMHVISSYCCWGGETSCVTSRSAVIGRFCWSETMVIKAFMSKNLLIMVKHTNK